MIFIIFDYFKNQPKTKLEQYNFMDDTIIDFVIW